jgi:hypothetical protein
LPTHPDGIIYQSVAVKKNAKNAEVVPEVVHINLGGIANEYMYFNCFSLGLLDGLVNLQLFYYEDNAENSRTVPVLNAVGTSDDLSTLLVSFKCYIAKIGLPESDNKYIVKGLKNSLLPITFQHLGVISRAGMGELIISQFSHKNAHDASQKTGTTIDSRTHGVYTSTREVHKKVIFELVQFIEKIALKNPI